MYSYSQTNAHLLIPPAQMEPMPKIKCGCQRTFIQQEIFTCINCSHYSCHYCTIPQFISLICRNCRTSQQTSSKNVRCKNCFSCPYCENVLTAAKDPKTKLYILLCQFCYWTTKDINIKEQKAENLLQSLMKLSSSLRDEQSKIYNQAYHFLKDSSNKIQRENHNFKYSYTINRKPMASMASLSVRNLSKAEEFNRSMIGSLRKQLDYQIPKCGLQDQQKQYQGDVKYPQGLPLIAKRIRRCAECKKQLTSSYRNSRTGESKIELFHKDFKVLNCQKNPPNGNIVKVKFVKQAYIDEQKFDPQSISEMQIDKEYKIKTKILAKNGKNVDIQYVFVIEKYSAGGQSTLNISNLSNISSRTISSRNTSMMSQA